MQLWTREGLVSKWFIRLKIYKKEVRVGLGRNKNGLLGSAFPFKCVPLGFNKRGIVGNGRGVPELRFGIVKQMEVRLKNCLSWKG